ncbi:MAG: NFACT family protein [Bacilli bacterium]|jgi:predicted ribosome quality control (RQC) complex YloA/Tae2 family protein|nr:NFACT family protein [Bacilli bacterium]
MSLSCQELNDYLKEQKSRLIGKHFSHPFLYSEKSIFFRVSGLPFHRFAIVLDDNDPRFYLSEDSFDVSGLDSKFIDQLKKDFSNAYLVDVNLLNEDRIVSFSFTIINSVYKEEGRTLIFEMLPHHCNLILLDEDGKVLASYRQSGLEEKRPLLRGVKYMTPEKKPFVIKKAEPFDSEEYRLSCLTKEKELADRRKKDRFGFLFSSLSLREKLLNRKIVKIQDDIDKGLSHINDNLVGDYIFTEMADSLKNRYESIEMDGKSIALDPSKSLSINAQLFYKRSKKAKESVRLGEKNLLAAKKEIDEVALSLSALKEADESGLESMAKELGIAPQKEKEKKRKETWKGISRDSIPYFIDYHGTKILFGTSSKQNDCLSFLFDTTKDHLWFHVMGDTGSHVMIKKESPTKDEILAACEVALINSKKDDGEVMMAERKDVRKGSVSGQAIVKKFTTIRISSIRQSTKNLVNSAKKYEF